MVGEGVHPKSEAAHPVPHGCRTFEVDRVGTGGMVLETSRHMRDVLLAKGYEVHYQQLWAATTISVGAKRSRMDSSSWSGVDTNVTSNGTTGASASHPTRPSRWDSLLSTPPCLRMASHSDCARIGCPVFTSRAGVSRKDWRRRRHLLSCASFPRFRRFCGFCPSAQLLARDTHLVRRACQRESLATPRWSGRRRSLMRLPCEKPVPGRLQR